MFIASLFDAHIRNIGNLNYSIYATFTVSAALELPADLGSDSIDILEMFQNQCPNSESCLEFWDMSRFAMP